MNICICIHTGLNDQGELALSEQSYGEGIGDFDKIAIDYGYHIYKGMYTVYM
jgi:hypothetical protein